MIFKILKSGIKKNTEVWIFLYKKMSNTIYTKLATTGIQNKKIKWQKPYYIRR